MQSPVSDPQVLSDDLVGFAGDSGILFDGPSDGFAGQGERARLEVLVEDSLSDALAEVRAFASEQAADGEPVFVRVPFSNDAPVVAVVAEEYRSGSSPKDEPTGESGRNLNIVALPSAPRWRATVERAIKAMNASDLTKVVLARQLFVTAESPFSALHLSRFLRARYPAAYCYSMDGFVGASPELLIARTGNCVSARPMAGTVLRGHDAAADAELRASLLNSMKDRSEHRILVDDLAAALRPFCATLEVPDDPSIVSLANVHHFATAISGELNEAHADVLTLLANIHPTPAVGGHPTKTAVAAIKELEVRPRGYYAGAIGWIDRDGNGSFALALRGAQLIGNQALLSAGAGILVDSDPAAEERETDAKFRVMLEALRS